MTKLKKQPTEKNSESRGVPSFFDNLKEGVSEIARKEFPSSQPKIERISPEQLSDLKWLVQPDYPKESAKKVWDGIQTVFNELNAEDQKAIIESIVYWCRSNLLELALKTNREIAEPVLNTKIENSEKEWRDLMVIEAARKGNPETVKLLLEKGADVNARDKDNWTPVLRACDNNHIDVVRILIENKANLNFYASWVNYTGLMLAACEGDIELVKLLIDNGAHVNSQDTFGRKALNFAVEGHHYEVEDLLKKHGARWEKRNA